ncbi:MAG: hypothetical protein QM723_23575 [Myxococcaceae bacterium]
MAQQNKNNPNEKKGIKNPDHGEPAKKDAPRDPSEKQMKGDRENMPRNPPGDYPAEPYRDEEEGLDEGMQADDEDKNKSKTDKTIGKNAGAESADDTDEEDTDVEESEQGDERHPQEPQPSHP